MKLVPHATAYSHQAPGDKQAHNQRQAGIFNSKTELFTAPLPEEVKQASGCRPRHTFRSALLLEITYWSLVQKRVLTKGPKLSLLQRLARIVNAVPDLGPDSRVMDVGSGTGCLIPFFRERGVRDILAVDLSPGMLAKVQHLS